MSNIAIWSVVTAVFLGLCIGGHWQLGIAIGLSVGVYDLRRIKKGKQTISNYTRGLIPAWLDRIIIVTTSIAAFVIGGWTWCLLWIAGVTVGHISVADEPVK